MKTPKQLEKHFKGIANHWRISILFLLDKEKELNLTEIARKVKGNFFTISEHARRLHIAGLIDKKYKAQEVHHSLSPYGKKFITFLKTAQQL
ncbi:MAG: winged helix-turn-helix domain-containing protein [bacterium]|nr:winged helix-turn-helix domain-containing protein [bacterium]